MDRIRALSLGTGFLMTALLGACSDAALLPPMTYPEANQVEQISMRESLHFRTDSSEPDPASQRRLQMALADVPSGRSVHVTLIGHADPRGADRYNLGLSKRRADRVRALMQQALPPGTDLVLEARGEVDATGNLPYDRRVDLIISIARAIPANCGPEAEAVGTADRFNEGRMGLGCSIRSNLARMVADPHDLLAGRPLVPADATREAEAVVRYRTDKVKAPKTEATN